MRNRPWLVSLIILTLVVPTAFAAQEARNEPVGAIGGTPSSIDWAVSAGYSKAVLTVVAPDGEATTLEFTTGSRPSVRLQDLGKVPQEGVYHYELRLVPVVSAASAAKLKSARASGDDKAAAKAQKEAGLDKTLVQSGAFTVTNGAFVSPDAQEGSLKGNSRSQTTTGASSEAGAGSVSAGDSRPWRQVVQDQVIPDDLIVQGSACVGLDCVNNESFGFDTIRMKENNTRVKFDDTSTSAGFPANDWQLTANDSASGGSSKFSIEDITGSKVPFTITAGAATNSMFVDSTGRLGLRTSTPVLDIHVATSNTPAMRLEQNSSGGFTAQTWDVAGNEANFFVRDVTGGSRLPFRIRPGAPTSSIDISASGNVGIGTASPGSSLHVTRSDGTSKFQVIETSGTGAARTLMNLQNNGQVVFRMKDTAQTPEWQFTASNAFQIDNTADPGVELQVNPDGALLVNGTTMNVPDYVFAPGYNLMPLSALAAFVEERRHLPNVPSATEINSEGLNLSQFPIKLLEKVEELTLYTIQQNKQIEGLAAENAELKARLSKIEAALLKGN